MRSSSARWRRRQAHETNHWSSGGASILSIQLHGLFTPRKTMKSNREICGQLRDRLLRLMLVIIKLVKQGMGASADRATLPSDLKNNIQQLQT